jgi:hypothetical protein
VTVKVEKLNPEVSVVFYGTRELTGAGDEQTAIRFTIDGEGDVVDTSERAKPLLRNVLGEKP